MAKTKSSVRGTQQKKIVVVKPYTRSDGVRVRFKINIDDELDISDILT